MEINMHSRSEKLRCRFRLVLALVFVVLALPIFAKETAADRLNFAKAFALEPVKDFRFFNIRSWRVLGDAHLIVEISRKQAYLLALDRPCVGLDFQQQIAITSFGRRVQAGFEYVVLHDPLRSVGYPERCRIVQIMPYDLRAYDLATSKRRRDSGNLYTCNRNS